MFTVLTAVLLTAGAPPQEVRFKRLYSSAANASSYLQNNWNKYSENYHPSYALDDDPASAWVEGVDGDGIGETITVPVSPLASAKAIQLKIRNGYQKSKPLFEKNAAVKDVELQLLGPSGTQVHAEKKTLTRAMGWQDVTLEIPGEKGFAAVRLKVVSVYPGTVYKDTCLSDLQIFVDSSIDYKEEVELAKKKGLAAWVKARRDEAKYFAKLPKTYPFAATHFDDTERFSANEPEEDDNGEKKEDFTSVDDQIDRNQLGANLRKTFTDAELALVKSVKALAKDKGKSSKRKLQRVVFANEVAFPDGIYPWVMAIARGYLDTQSPSYFETTEATFDATAAAKKRPENETLKKLIRANALVEWTDEAKRIPKSIYVWEHAVEEERSVYETDRHHLLVFNAAGRPEQIATYEDGTNTAYRIVSLEWNADGKIAAVKSASAMHDTEMEPGNSYYMQSFAPQTAVARKD